MDALQILLKDPFTRFSRRYLKLAASGDVTPAGVLLLLAVADKTVSWRQLWAELSFTDLEEMTGLSRRHVGRTVKALLEAGLLARKSLDDGFVYALVPEGWTTTQVLADGVDNLTVAGMELGTSCPQGQGHHVPDSADLSFVFKKPLKKAAGAAVLVDSGLRGRASGSCPTCSGAGWVFITMSDGFTEAAAPCPCTGS